MGTLRWGNFLTGQKVTKDPPKAGPSLRWGNFLTGQKVTKDPPKAGPSPALWNPPRGTGCACVLLFAALGLVGSHRWHGKTMGSACSSDEWCFYCQGLTLVSRCSQLSVTWLPAAGTPLYQSRPGDGKHPAIGPAAQGNLVWWQYQEPQQGRRAEYGLDAGKASYHREVLRGERPKRVLVPFARSKGTPSGERPRQAGKPEPCVVRRTPHRLPDGRHLPLHRGAFGMAETGTPAGSVPTRPEGWNREPIERTNNGCRF